MQANANEGSLEAEATAIDVSISDQDLRVACFCEENVWRLLARKLHHDAADDIEYYVAIISNDRKAVAMQNQKAARRGEIVCWDYHVILLCFQTPRDQASSNDSPDGTNRTMFVYDVDTTLQPYPMKLTDYIQMSFSSEVAPAFRPEFRIIRGDVFRAWFSSDRRHMWDSKEHQWSATPPPYACIANINTTDPHTLVHYINFREEKGDCPLPQEALGILVPMEMFLCVDQWRFRLN